MKRTAIALALLAALCLAADPCRCPDITNNGIDEGLTIAIEVAKKRALELCDDVAKYKSAGPCLGAGVVWSDLVRQRRQHREAPQ